MNNMHVFKSIVSSTHRRLPRIATKRTTLVIVLSAMFSMLGSITLSSSAFWGSISSGRTAIASVIRPTTAQAATQMPTQKSASTPTQTPLPAPVLAYPLYSGNAHLPEIALTFDDGPNPIYTPQILALLQEYRVKATFFDVGYLVTDYPNLVRQEYSAGNSVGNHSWSHPELTLLSASAIWSQLTRTSTAIQATIGVRPTLFRPPYGAINGTVLAEANYLGVTTVLWNDSAGDWALPGVSVIASKILRQAGNGAIILLHDGGGNRSQSVAALPIIITALEHRGFTFVTIQQMVDDLKASTSQVALISPLTQTTISKTIEGTLAAWRRKTYVI
jgi:peptidoglycan/xylan/chitin deacetylase (PgdA/CDA1 family)